MTLPDIKPACKKLAEMEPDKFQILFAKPNGGDPWVFDVNKRNLIDSDFRPLTQDALDAILKEEGIQVYVRKFKTGVGWYPHLLAEIFIDGKFTEDIDTHETEKLAATCVGFNRAIELLEEERKK